MLYNMNLYKKQPYIQTIKHILTLPFLNILYNQH